MLVVIVAMLTKLLERFDPDANPDDAEEMVFWRTTERKRSLRPNRFQSE